MTYFLQFKSFFRVFLISQQIQTTEFKSAYFKLGVAQIVELSNQLRGRCGKRQVPNVKLAMQHNIGIGGAVVVGLYQRADGGSSPGGGTTSLSMLGVDGLGGGGGAGGNSGGSGDSEFKSDVVFEEIKSRAAEVSQFLRCWCF